MIIKRLAASFGGLDNQELVLEKGLNIIAAPNEAGKSTWSAFICAMLYGVNTAERDSKNTLSDKTRFRPWSGAPMQGLMELEADGIPITIERKTSGRALMQDFSAYNTLTGETIGFLSADNCGQVLLGVEKSVFERSAFIRQTGLLVDQSPELERRLMSLVTTGDESTSYSSAENRLKAWQRARKYNKSGAIPVLEAEIVDIEKKLSSLRELNQKNLEQTMRVERLKSKREDYQAQLKVAEAIELQKKLDYRDQAKLEFEEARQTAEQYEFPDGTPEPQVLNSLLRGLELLEQMEREASYIRPQDELPNFPFPDVFLGKSPEEAWQTATEDTERCNRLSSSKSMLLPMAILSLAWVACLALIFFFVNAPFLWASVFTALFAVTASVLSVIRKRQAKVSQEKLADVLSKYSSQNISGILDLASQYREYTALAEQKKREQEMQKRELDAKTENYLEKKQALFSIISGFAQDADTILKAREAVTSLMDMQSSHAEAIARLESARKIYESVCRALEDTPAPDPAVLISDVVASMDKKDLASELGRINGELSLLAPAVAMTRGEAKVLGDPAALAAGLQTANDKKQSLLEEYDAIELALSSLKSAHETLQSRFSPQLNERAGEIFNKFTGGRYEKILLDRSMNAAVLDPDGVVSRKSLALSAGTADQLYLAVRLAICDLVFPSDKSVPLVLDDALLNFDDTRMAYALDWLEVEANWRQIILFSCHNREELYLKKREDVNIVKK